MECKNCGEEIFLSRGWWFHTVTDKTMCEPMTHAEPQDAWDDHKRQQLERDVKDNERMMT